MLSASSYTQAWVGTHQGSHTNYFQLCSYWVGCCPVKAGRVNAAEANEWVLLLPKTLHLQKQDLVQGL